MTLETGSSLLTEAPASPAGGGNPPNAALNAAQQALADAHEANQVPEYIPEKFWDPKAKGPKIEELGRSYKNLEKLLGTEKAPIPTDWDDPEQVERWYKAGGRPEAPDKYEFKRPELPNDLSYDEDTEKAFRTWAHANGLNKKQATNLYDAYVKTQVERHAAWHTGQKQGKEKIVSDLMREHGNQYEGKVNLARTAIREFADPDYLKWLDESGMGNDPRMIRAWIKVGEKMTGETKLAGKAPDATASLDLERAIADFREKHWAVMVDRGHPDHDRRNKEYHRLFEARYGDQ